MIRYYDTSVLLKLYTEEPQSQIIRQLVVEQRKAIVFTSFHFSESVSALMLKVGRKECSLIEAKRAVLDIEEDISAGVLKRQAVDWERVWVEAKHLSFTYAEETGCRTLDVLHIACAKELGLREFVTGDLRQRKLAERLGMRVIVPY